MSPDELLTTTRAVRKRLDLDRPVDLAVIEDCLRLAVQAPSGGNRQDWRFLVVTDSRQKARLADSYRTGALDAFTAARESATEEGSRKAYEGALHLAETLERVPVIVIPCQVGRPPGSTNQAAAGFYGSVIPAVWSFMLALRSRGLGATYTTAHLRREGDVAEIFGIPDGVTQIAMLPVAYTIGTHFKPAERLPVSQVAFHDRWGSAW